MDKRTYKKYEILAGFYENRSDLPHNQRVKLIKKHNNCLERTIFKALKFFNLEHLWEKPEVKERKRAYWGSIYGEEDYGGFLIVARSVKHAKQIMFNTSEWDIESWIDVRAKWWKEYDKKVQDFEYGIIMAEVGLREGLYSSAHIVCEQCGEFENMSTDNLIEDKFVCDNCVSERRE